MPLSSFTKRWRGREAEAEYGRRLDKAVRDITALREKLIAQTECTAVAQRRVTVLRERLDQVKTRLENRRRGALTDAVLAHLLSQKAAHRPVLPEDVAAALAREERLLAASPAYRVASGDPAGRQQELQRVQIEGLPWWIPVDAQVPNRAERAVAQSFPFRAILQAREVALGGIMLDLGANIGRTSIPRVLLGDVRAVYAAEPEPANYACLVQNLVEHSLGGFVLPDQAAIGAARGEVALRRSRYIGGHRVLHGPQRKAVPTVTVPVWPVDEWMPHVGADPEAVSFVKVDTQGSEVTVLRGAASLLARRRAAWQIEVDPALLTTAGTGVRDLFATLEPHFTHFIDTGRGSAGGRVRPIELLAEALAYVGLVATKTDIILYNARR